MKIDIGDKLDEKQSKELISSIKRLIAYTYHIFEKTVKEDKESKSLTIEFDNGDIFLINTTLNNNKYINTYNYYDNCDNKKKEIPLQSALNINKYCRDIEIKLKNNSNVIIEGYFTEQKLGKFPIFKLEDVGLEQKIKTESEDIELEFDNY